MRRARRLAHLPQGPCVFKTNNLRDFFNRESLVDQFANRHFAPHIVFNFLITRGAFFEATMQGLRADAELIGEVLNGRKD